MSKEPNKPKTEQRKTEQPKPPAASVAPPARNTPKPPAVAGKTPARAPANAPKAEAGTIAVVATKAGYHDLVYRNPGDAFVLRPVKGAKVTLSAEDQFSDEWMRRAGDPEPEEGAPDTRVPTSAAEAADAKNPSHGIPRSPDGDELPL